VVAAHDECVRLEVSNGGPYQLRLSFWVRQREGRMSERHPTLEAAIEVCRRRRVEHDGLSDTAALRSAPEADPTSTT
jgi:hypothetical protein